MPRERTLDQLLNRAERDTRKALVKLLQSEGVTPLTCRLDIALKTIQQTQAEASKK